MASPTLLDVAAALSEAYTREHGTAPAPDLLVYPLAQLSGAEGSLSSYFLGTNNLGAMHATAAFARAHAGQGGYGAVAFLDHAPGGGAYIARMRVYPTLLEGAAGFLSLVESMGALEHTTSSEDYASALYAHGYFEGMRAPATPIASRLSVWSSGSWTDADRQNISDYAAAIDRSSSSARAALSSLPSYSGDPAAFVSGPPFASLADRLTPAPAYAPHTLSHARMLLGDAADHPPPGSVSLADALSAPGGDGVWMFSQTPAAADSGRARVSPATVVAGALALAAAGAVVLALSPLHWPRALAEAFA